MGFHAGLFEVGGQACDAREREREKRAEKKEAENLAWLAACGCWLVAAAVDETRRDETEGIMYGMNGIDRSTHGDRQDR